MSKRPKIKAVGLRGQVAESCAGDKCIGEVSPAYFNGFNKRSARLRELIAFATKNYPNREIYINGERYVNHRP